MPIYKENKEITVISKGSKLVDYIYKGSLLIWQAIKSCFGSGFWVNEKGWYNEEGWRNNKRI